MEKYLITTESTSDFPENYIKKSDLAILPLEYTVDGQTFGRTRNIPAKEFYNRLRNGSLSTTAAAIPADIRDFFVSILEQGMDILHISFSSALSCTYNNSNFIAQELMEEYPGRKIIVIDSLCASLGQGLLVATALKMQARGKSPEETAEWLEAHKLNLCSEFTVDDLMFLQRGGRIKKATAILGSIINVKPVMHMNNEGRLVAVGNVRGRKKSLNALVDAMAAAIDGFDYRNEEIFIGHGDCPEDAEYVRSKVQERFGITNFVIGDISPIIGAHSGPGTVALFYYGKSRELTLLEKITLPTANDTAAKKPQLGR